MPTQKMIQTKVGDMFSRGRFVPISPAATRSRSTIAPRDRRTAISTRLDRTGPIRGTPSRLRRGYETRPEPPRTNTESTTNEAATVAAAPTTNRFRGRGRS